MKYSFSGNRDHDLFDTKEDMGAVLWDILMSCHHSGSCDDDCNTALDYFVIDDVKAAREYIDSVGIDVVNYVKV